MSELGLLERSGKADPRKSRLFLAVRPEADAALHVGALARRLRGDHGLAGRPLLDERFHVTLQWFGDFDELPHGLVASISLAMDGLVMAPFEVTFDRVVSFKRRRAFNQPLVLQGGERLASLHELHRRIGVALTTVGFEADPNPRFTPHVTLLYDDRSLAEREVEPVSWTVRDVVLIQSLIGKTRHVVLGRWKLKGDG